MKKERLAEVIDLETVRDGRITGMERVRKLMDSLNEAIREEIKHIDVASLHNKKIDIDMLIEMYNAGIVIDITAMNGYMIEETTKRGYAQYEITCKTQDGKTEVAMCYVNIESIREHKVINKIKTGRVSLDGDAIRELIESGKGIVGSQRITLEVTNMEVKQMTYEQIAEEECISVEDYLEFEKEVMIDSLNIDRKGTNDKEEKLEIDRKIENITTNGIGKEDVTTAILGKRVMIRCEDTGEQIVIKGVGKGFIGRE